MTELKLYNSLSREKQAFEPIDSNNVRLYACGPTVYNYAHIGNARMAVVFDLLSRLLKSIYPKVTYVSNITDVDDKIIKASQETGEPIDTITKKYTEIYNNDMAALGAGAPDKQPLATQHIDSMIELIQTLIDKNHAYTSGGHVLFHVPSFENYGGLSGRSRDEQIAGARVEVASYKKDPADFVLWKPSNENEPGWNSPWGLGRPGWHIECSAMSQKILGLPFDIHGGGADLKFPHHENEIAQSCCANGTGEDLASFAKYWVHNGFVTVDGEKMSKSLGNFLLAHDLLKDYKGEALRLTLLSAHYRQPLNWSEEKVRQSTKTLDRFYKRLNEMHDIKAADTDMPQGVQDALCDDLNTPKAMAEMNALLKQENSAELKGQILKAGSIIGILQSDPAQWCAEEEHNMDAKESAAIDALVIERTQAKAEKNWARADEIRDELQAKGITITDTPDGTKWKKVI